MKQQAPVQNLGVAGREGGGDEGQDISGGGGGGGGSRGGAEGGGRGGGCLMNRQDPVNMTKILTQS